MRWKGVAVAYTPKARQQRRFPCSVGPSQKPYPGIWNREFQVTDVSQVFDCDSYGHQLTIICFVASNTGEANTTSLSP